MGLTERHWFENEDVPENYEWDLEDAVYDSYTNKKPENSVPMMKGKMTMIDREKVIKNNAIRGLRSAIEISGSMVHLRKEYAKAILDLLKEQEKAGTWKQIDDDTNIWSCSECDEPFILMDGTPIENKYYYCPQCGAKMRT